MPRRTCAVPGCFHHYFKNSIKKSLFKPKNEEQLDLWRKALPTTRRELQMDDVVCELHFTEHDIGRNSENLMSDNSVRNIKKNRPQLKQNAVPSIFPCSQTHWTRASLKRNLSTDEVASDSLSETVIGAQKRNRVSPSDNLSTKTSSVHVTQAVRKGNELKIKGVSKANINTLLSCYDGQKKIIVLPKNVQKNASTAASSSILTISPSKVNPENVVQDLGETVICAQKTVQVNTENVRDSLLMPIKSSSLCVPQSVTEENKLQIADVSGAYSNAFVSYSAGQRIITIFPENCDLQKNSSSSFTTSSSKRICPIYIKFKPTNHPTSCATPFEAKNTEKNNQNKEKTNIDVGSNITNSFVSPKSQENVTQNKEYKVKKYIIKTKLNKVNSGNIQTNAVAVLKLPTIQNTVNVVEAESGNFETTVSNGVEKITFDMLVESVESVQRHNHLWGITVHDGFVMCAKWKKDLSLDKRVIISSGLDVQVFLRNRKLEYGTAQITTLMELNALLQKIDSYALCQFVDDLERTICQGYTFRKSRHGHCEPCRKRINYEINKKRQEESTGSKYVKKKKVLQEKIRLLTMRNQLFNERAAKLRKLLNTLRVQYQKLSRKLKKHKEKSISQHQESVDSEDDVV